MHVGLTCPLEIPGLLAQFRGRPQGPNRLPRPRKPELSVTQATLEVAAQALIVQSLGDGREPLQVAFVLIELVGENEDVDLQNQ